MIVRKNNQAGFSLVETLVAITILLLVVAGPMTVSMSTARSTGFAAEQVQAFLLAQEGAELAQKARDEIVLPGIDESPMEYYWDDFANPTSGDFTTCFDTNGCALGLNNEGGVVIAVGDCVSGACKLYYNDDGERSRYTYDSQSASTTPFTRTITFQRVEDWDVKVVSKVTWRTGTLRKTQEVEVETHLFDTYR
jgi:prepilin-type N-terminal cleavage/methylation domain-containing protein